MRQNPADLGTGRRALLLGLLVGAAWLLGTSSLLAEPGATEARSELKGVVVEEVGEGSALARAGVRVGDVLFSWERLPNPPLNPEGGQGEVSSVFDWMWLEFEQAPRGNLRILGQRNQEEKSFEIPPTKWSTEVRPQLGKRELELYSKGHAASKAEDFQTAIDRWSKLAADMEPEAEWHIKSWIHLRIGDAWSRAGQRDKAVESYEAALAEASSSHAQAVVWETVCRAHRKSGDMERAYEACYKALEARREDPDQDLSLARGEYKLGEVFYYQGSAQAAELHFQRSMQARRQLAPESEDLVASLIALGAIAWDRGDLQLATQYFNDSLKIQETLDPTGSAIATIYLNLANLAWIQGKLQSAHDLYLEALRIHEHLDPDGLKAATALNGLGLVESARGELALAMSYYQRSLKIREDHSPISLHTANSLINLGNLAWQRGDLQMALEYNRRALTIHEESAPDSPQLALSLNNLGTVYDRQGELALARATHERALEIRQRLAPQSLDLAASLTNLGIIALESNDLSAALSYHERALEIKRHLAPHSAEVSRGLVNLGSVHYQSGDLDLAEDLFQQALAAQERLASSSLLTSKIFSNLGTVAADRSRLQIAKEFFEKALEIRATLAPESSAYAKSLQNLADLARREHRDEQAAELYQRAIEALEAQIGMLGGSHDLQAKFRAQHRRCYRGAVETLLELDRSKQAFALLERSRGRAFVALLAERDILLDAGVPEHLSRERKRIAVLYDQAQEELAKLNPRENGAQLDALLSRQLELQHERENLIAEIRRASPKLAAIQYPQPLTLREARATLDPGTAMLSFSVGEEQTDLFVLVPEGPLEVHSIPVGKEAIADQVRRLHRLTHGSGWNHVAASRQALARQLYRTLIQPAAETLEHCGRLLIVPDGPLHRLPFATLVRDLGEIDPVDGRDWQYLVEWKPLHSVLSSTVYKELLATRRQPRDPSSGYTTPIQLAAFGDPHYPRELAHTDTNKLADMRVRSAVERGLFDFQPLPHSRREVEHIAALYSPRVVRAYLGADATEERAKTLGRDVRIVHFATHASVDDRFPLNSALALTIPEELTEGGDNGLLQVWEIFERLRIDADLVVLSACETGLGEELDGEGLIGLTRAFQYAGARSVVASLWRVSDATTAELMTRFYRHLHDGKSKDEALRAAQIELIRGPIQMANDEGDKVEKDASAPYHWAAFQVIGDWR